MQEVAQQRLAGRQVAVGLDPAAADRDELPAATFAADPRPQLGLALLHPGVMHRLRAGEAVARGTRPCSRAGSLKRAHAFAVGLGERPEPGRVDVRVADRGQLVRMRAVRVLVELRQDRGVPVVAEALQPLAQRTRQARVDALAGLERTQRLEVEVAAPGVRVEDARARSGAARRAPPARRTCRCRRARARRRSPPASLGVLRSTRLGMVAVEPLGGTAVEPERRPRWRSPRAGRRAGPPTPPARSPRPGTSRSPRAARSARRAPPAGSRARAPPRGRSGRRPRDEQLVERRASRAGSLAERSEACARRARVYSRWRIIKRSESATGAFEDEATRRNISRAESFHCDATDRERGRPRLHRRDQPRHPRGPRARDRDEHEPDGRPPRGRGRRRDRAAHAQPLGRPARGARSIATS